MSRRFYQALLCSILPLAACSATAPESVEATVESSTEALTLPLPPIRIPPIHVPLPVLLGMSAENYEAMFDKTGGDCTVRLYPTECNAENAYAQSKLLLTAEAANLGKTKGLYPLLDRSERIVAVCACAKNNDRITGSSEPQVTPPPPPPPQPKPPTPPAHPSCSTGKRCCEPAPGGGCLLCVSGNQACP
jgi:hypothetical protein